MMNDSNESRAERSEARLDEHARARDDQYEWSSAPTLGVAMLFFILMSLFL
jgi:hypothetical protein